MSGASPEQSTQIRVAASFRKGRRQEPVANKLALSTKLAKRVGTAIALLHMTVNFITRGFVQLVQQVKFDLVEAWM